MHVKHLAPHNKKGIRVDSLVIIAHCCHNNILASPPNCILTHLSGRYNCSTLWLLDLESFVYLTLAFVGVANLDFDYQLAVALDLLDSCLDKILTFYPTA